MNKVKPYEKYKDSGISWLGEIPEHWERTQLNKIFLDNKIKNEDLNENNLLTLSYGKIKRKDINSSNGLLPASFSNYQIVEQGDIVLRMLDLQNDKTSLRVGFVNEKGIITSAYIGLRLKLNYSSKYFYTLLNHLDLIKHFYNGGGGVRQSISFSEIGKERMPLPTLTEQTAIANFLDYKTAKIDRFIFKKKQLIKLLNEQKAGIINDAVTKGLNPDVKMKPSRIEWLGDIPEHWEVRKLWLLIIKSELGGNYSAGESSQGIPLMKMGNLGRGNIKLNKVEFIDSDVVYQSSHILKKDDFLFNTRNSAELVGKVSLWRTELPFALFNSNILKIEFNASVSNSYMNLFFNSKAMINALRIISKGTTSVAAIYYKDLSKMEVCFPNSIDEQTAIISHIEKETAIITKTIATIEKEIALVQEYRTALIAEAVTGKIDVREYKIPSFEAEKEYAETEEEMSLVAEDGGEI